MAGGTDVAQPPVASQASMTTARRIVYVSGTLRARMLILGVVTDPTDRALIKMQDRRLVHRQQLALDPFNWQRMTNHDQRLEAA
jgi:hypothetical protein